jgi:hypothetical protein
MAHRGRGQALPVLLVFGHIVLGERELDHAGRIEIDAASLRFTFHPDPSSLWGQRYPDAVYHLVTSTPDAIEAVGGDELLYADGKPRAGAYVALRTRATDEVRFAVVGSMTDPEAAKRLAVKYERWIEDGAMLALAAKYWEGVTRGLRITGNAPGVAALDTVFPWLAHNAMVHLTVSHGLEQYSGAAWGTRDVCQGPLEFLLTLEHDEPVKEILRIVFRAAVRVSRRLAAVVHARALCRDPRPPQPRRRDRLAAEGAVRLHRGHKRFGVPRRANCVAAGR